MAAARFGSALLLALILLFTVACRAEPQVTILTRSGQRVTFEVEIADTPEKRERGLQYRRELSMHRGMLFLFPGESRLSFWMRNTPIALDMIFIDRHGTIVGIVEQAAPFSTDARSVEAPSQYVLEINGGLARRYGIRAGDNVRFRNVPLESIRE